LSQARFRKIDLTDDDFCARRFVCKQLFRDRSTFVNDEFAYCTQPDEIAFLKDVGHSARSWRQENPL
jgi:hypothetical protein